MMLLSKCKLLGRTIKSRDIAEMRVCANPRELVPSRDIADALVDNYFRAFESTYRVLHIPTFLREYEAYWGSPESTHPVFVLKLLLVLAIGICVSDDRSSRRSHISALQWINAAQSWIGSPFNEKAKLSISGIQVYCLLLLARETASVSPDLIWIATGSLLRTATLIGLHRDPSHFPRLTAFQSEIRRRLWASVMEICLQASMNAGGLPNISANMHDCQPPLNLNDADMDETTRVAAPAGDGVFTQASLQIALMQTMSVRCRIAKSLNDFRSDPSFSETIEIGTELTQSLHQLTSQLRTSRTNSELVRSDADVKMYQLMTQRFLMSLHQTYSIKAMTEPRFYYARKVCLDTSLAVCAESFPVSQSAPDADSRSDFASIIEVSSGTVKNVLTLAFMMISLELTTQMEGAHPLSTGGVVEDMVRREILRMLQAFSEYSLARIKAGETNVKGYVFSISGLESIRALQAGTSSEEAALAASLQATRLSIEILEGRLDEISVTPATAAAAAVSNLSSEETGESQQQQQHEFGMDGADLFLLGDDFGWDDWDPRFNLKDGGDFFLSLP